MDLFRLYSWSIGAYQQWADFLWIFPWFLLGTLMMFLVIALYGVHKTQELRNDVPLQSHWQQVVQIPHYSEPQGVTDNPPYH